VVFWANDFGLARMLQVSLLVLVVHHGFLHRSNETLCSSAFALQGSEPSPAPHPVPWSKFGDRLGVPTFPERDGLVWCKHMIWLNVCDWYFFVTSICNNFDRIWALKRSKHVWLVKHVLRLHHKSEDAAQFLQRPCANQASTL